MEITSQSYYCAPRFLLELGREPGKTFQPLYFLSKIQHNTLRFNLDSPNTPCYFIIQFAHEMMKESRGCILSIRMYKLCMAN